MFTCVFCVSRRLVLLNGLFVVFFVFIIVSLPEHGGEHECEHDDGQAKGEHEGQEDPVVGRRGVEDDEVDQDAGDH